MLTRRRFLSLGLAGGALALIFGVGRCGRQEEPGRSREVQLLDLLADSFFAAPRPNTLSFPRPSDLDAGRHAWAFAQHLPRVDQWQVKGLLRLVEWSSIAWAGSRFSRLDPDLRLGVLGAWASSSRTSLRLVVGALKQLCAMGVFRHPQVWAAIGYDGPTVSPERP
ncbi:MAG: hypothetical protein QGG40_12460 [Myxococcota bacterium]|jgi:hypothetical protein|nr:hypothetical protein [Myxococcota bacterium]